MKKKFILIALLSALPLAAVIFALRGYLLNSGVYLIFAVLHLVVVSGLLWLIYKDMEKKISNAGKRR